MYFQTNNVNNEINKQDKYKNKNEYIIKSLRKLKTHKIEINKGDSYNNYLENNDIYSEKSYDTSKKYNRKINYINYKKTTHNGNSSNHQKINNYNHQTTIINKDYKIPYNDKMRNNSFKYFIENNNVNNFRSISSIKINNNLENRLSKYQTSTSKLNDKIEKNMSGIIIKNKELKYKNIIKNKEKIDLFYSNIIDKKRQKTLIKSEKRKTKKDLYILDRNPNNNYYDITKNYNQHSTNNDNHLIQMNDFEIYDESGERNTYYNKIRKNTNNEYEHNNVFCTNFNLEEEKKNNIYEDYENKNIYSLSEYNKKSYINNIDNKFHVIHKHNPINNHLINLNNKIKNINDSIEIKDLNNHKNISIINSSCIKRNIKSNINNSCNLKKNEYNFLNNYNNQKIISNYNSNRNNKSIDINNLNENDNIKKNRSTYLSYQNSNIMNLPNIINNEKTINLNGKNNSINNNVSKKQKKIGNITQRKIKFKKYHRQSDIQKIILIQSMYRAYFLRLKLSNTLRMYYYLQKLFECLLKILYIRKKNYWKYFLKKLFNKIIPKNKNKKISSKLKKVKNPILNTNNKIILKANKIKILHKESSDSFNIINNNNDLKLKLEEMIKENNMLKNQLFDKNNIEEQLNQLIIKNKKNQNINSIIVKDNQKLAKKLKNIRENKINTLVIQKQKAFDLNIERNFQMMYTSKLRKLNLKFLILKKLYKIKNHMRIYFNRYRYKIKKFKNYTIENKNFLINNSKKINIQMTKNFDINYISQNEKSKNSLLYKLFIKRENRNKKIILQFFYKLLYLSKLARLEEVEEKNENEKEEEKKIKLKSIFDKYERNYKIKYKNIFYQWRLRSVIVKMKTIAKEIKRKKKLKKKIKDKMAKESLNYLKNKTNMLKSAHELSYNIKKKEEKEDSDINKNNKILKTQVNEEIGKNINEQDDSGDSIGTGD